MHHRMPPSLRTPNGNAANSPGPLRSDGPKGLAGTGPAGTAAEAPLWRLAGRVTGEP